MGLNFFKNIYVVSHISMIMLYDDDDEDGDDYDDSGGVGGGGGGGMVTVNCLRSESPLGNT